MRFRWLLAALFLATATLVAFTEITGHHLWYPYPWLDIPMHILAGFAVGVFLVALLGRRNLLAFVALMAAVAIGWELFEYFSGITAGEAGYLLDTGHDLLDDAIGATASYWLARTSIWR